MLRDLSDLLPYLRRYRVAYITGTLCILFSIALKLLIPYLLGDSIDRLRSLAEESGTGGGDAIGLIARSAVTIILTAVGVAVFRTLSRLKILGTSRRVAHDMRDVLFDRLLLLAPSFYVRNPTGQIMSRCINDMRNVQGLTGPVIMYLGETATLFVLGLAMMVRLEPTLTAASLLPFPFFLYGARRIARQIQEGSRAAQNSLADISNKVDESLSGQLVIKTLTLEDHDLSQFDARCREYRRRNLDVTRQRAILIPMMMGLVSLSTIIVLAIGGPRVTRGELSLGSIVTMILYLQMLAGPTRTLGFIISSLKRGAAALARIREIRDTEITLRDPPDASGVAPIEHGEVRVRSLRIVYPPLAEQPHLSGSLPDFDPRLVGDPAAPELTRDAAERAGDGQGGDRHGGLRTAGDRPGDNGGGAADDPAATLPDRFRSRCVLDAIDLDVPAGSTLGIVGHTGAGKTTLVRAIARQIEIDPGTVWLDGVDLTRRPLAALRRAIGFVPQDAFLFSASLADNIALGRPDATAAEIEAAADAARLTPDIDQLPGGFDTLVGERGVKLSGGQRQRAALARVMLLDPRILVLDDALSAVDTHTADEILASLRRFATDRTTILVSHRLSTVQHADQIILLENGRIVERGTHGALLEQGGRYARLHARQLAVAERTRALELDPALGGETEGG
jgi:ATP-binding cassette subfamily B protein